MKKMLEVFGLLALIASVSLTSCSDRSNIVQIGDRMFATQVIHLYMNATSYEGRTIRFEGAFMKEGWELFPYFTSPYNLVVRFLDDNCCGGGVIGFEVKMPQDSTFSFPAHNSWVEVTGVLYLDSYSIPYLVLSSPPTVLATRGMEIVRL
jgi:uncharacterized membrane protein YcgQ (UPF0703/DUF1980 family)